MGLLSIFKRQADSASSGAAAAAASEPGDAVQRARTRARQRLIGAAVLVVIGIVGFPLVFETQPRPIPVDIPIEVPRKDGAPPLVMPVGRVPGPAAAASATQAAPPAGPMAAARNDVITESRADAGRDVPASSPAPTSVADVAPTEAVSSKPAAPGNDGLRARALLEGKPAEAAESKRFVVQVGAFADAGAAHETRLKVEKLGLKTYTQVASTSAGDRIRVRVGPFGTRDEADKAMAKARGAGLAAVVLTL